MNQTNEAARRQVDPSRGGVVPTGRIPDAARYCIALLEPPTEYGAWEAHVHALHDCGVTMEEADAWSALGAKYVPGEVARRWAGYSSKADADPNKAIGGLINLAKAHPAFSWPEMLGQDGGAAIDVAIGWDDEISLSDRHASVVVTGRPQSTGGTAEGGRGQALPFALDRTKLRQVDPPERSGAPATEQAAAWLDAVFSEGDTVALAEAVPGRDGRLRPGNPVFMTVGQAKAADLGRYAFVLANPCDGAGVKGENVAAYRHALIECDPDKAEWEAWSPEERAAELERQARELLALNLPIAALTYSGNKSVHALVRLDAGDGAEYARRMEWLHAMLEANGFHADGANKNPNRWTRLAGATRADTGQAQALMATHEGAEGWQEWTRWAEERRDPWAGFASEWAASWEEIEHDYLNPPPVTPTYIEPLDRALGGGMRPGPHVLMGMPGSGKTALALQVAANVALRGEGVVYASIELTASQCAARLCSRIAYDRLDGTCGRFLTSDWEKMGAEADRRGIEALKALKRHAPRLTVVDKEEATTLDGLRRLLCEASKAGAALVVIDYLQRVRAGQPGANSYEEARQVIHGLTGASKAARMPILVVSSMSRAGMRAEGAPMSAGAGCGDIEYDAISIWQLRNWPPVSPKKKEEEERGESKEQAERRRKGVNQRALYLPKNRYGISSETKKRATLDFVGWANKFEPMADVPDGIEGTEPEPGE